MQIEARPVELAEVGRLRDLYRAEANCQIIHDSFLPRQLADPYLLLADGRIAGYGSFSKQYGPPRILEFYTVPAMRGDALGMFRELLATSGATHIEAQSNIRLMLTMLYDCASSISVENILFEDGLRTFLPSPGGIFRQVGPEETNPDGDWVVESDAGIVASGGYLCHYNPPYGDIYMSVAESARRRGYGSYIVQELKRVTYEGGRKPAARCNADNFASRRTLERAGMFVCGRLLLGEVKAPAL